MDYLIILSVQTMSTIAALFLLCAGLAIIFGMMKVINFAHGEFFMMGAFVTVLSVNSGVNFWLASLVLAPLAVGVLGLVIEWCVIRHLYGRMIDTMLATWGLSLGLMGLADAIFGNTVTGISDPLGAVAIGRYSTSIYELVLIGVAAALFVLLFALFKYTKWGLIARAAMQNPHMTAALGLEPRRVYSLTFVIGSALTGLAGGVIAPLTSVTPVMGLDYIANAFITVICAGPAVLLGTSLAASLFGSVNNVFTFMYSSVFGQVALLATAIILLRFSPKGLTAGKLKKAI